jgi:DNA-binding GntR family transcriptional regulator
VLNATLGDLGRLETLQRTINAGLDDGDYRAALHANYEFHFLIYRRSGWSRLVAMIESLWLRVGPSFHDLYPEFATTRKGVSNHMAAMDGLRRRNGAKVRKAMEQDIKDGYDRLSAMLKGRRKI